MCSRKLITGSSLPTSPSFCLRDLQTRQAAECNYHNLACAIFNHVSTIGERTHSWLNSLRPSRESERVRLKKIFVSLSECEVQYIFLEWVWASFTLFRCLRSAHKTVTHFHIVHIKSPFEQETGQQGRKTENFQRVRRGHKLASNCRVIVGWCKRGERKMTATTPS